MHFVPVKSFEQQSMLCIHRLREGIQQDRTALHQRHSCQSVVHFGIPHIGGPEFPAKSHQTGFYLKLRGLAERRQGIKPFGKPPEPLVRWRRTATIGEIEKCRNPMNTRPRGK